MKTAGLVRTTYEIVTPESAEEGEADDRGWIDEEGEECTPQEAFKMVRGCDPSSSQFRPGVWYTDTEYDMGESRSYHLNGFTKKQEEDIYDSVEAGSWVGLDEDEEDPEGYPEDPHRAVAEKLIQAARTLLAANLDNRAENTPGVLVYPAGHQFEKHNGVKAHKIGEDKGKSVVQVDETAGGLKKAQWLLVDKQNWEPTATTARTRLASDYSEEELAALSIMDMLKPSYRAQQFERAGLGAYTKESPVLQSLAAKGIVKFQANGIALDKPLAKAVMKRHEAPAKYKQNLENYSMQFQRKAPVEDTEVTSRAAALLARARQLLADGESLAKGTAWRLRVRNRETMVLEEVPQPGVKKLRRSTLNTLTGRGWRGFDPLLPSNLVHDAKLAPADSFDEVKKKLQAAVDEAATLVVSELGEKYEWAMKSLQWYDEGPVSSHAHEPDDTRPILANGQDFTLKCTWDRFSAYDPGSDFQSHDPTYTVVQSTSDSQARKLHKLLSKDPQALSTIQWSKLPEWLKSKGVASKTNHSVYR